MLRRLYNNTAEVIFRSNILEIYISFKSKKKFGTNYKDLMCSKNTIIISIVVFFFLIIICIVILMMTLFILIVASQLAIFNHLAVLVYIILTPPPHHLTTALHPHPLQSCRQPCNDMRPYVRNMDVRVRVNICLS